MLEKCNDMKLLKLYSNDAMYHVYIVDLAWQKVIAILNIKRKIHIS